MVDRTHFSRQTEVNKNPVLGPETIGKETWLPVTSRGPVVQSKLKYEEMSVLNCCRSERVSADTSTEISVSTIWQISYCNNNILRQLFRACEKLSTPEKYLSLHSNAFRRSSAHLPQTRKSARNSTCTKHRLVFSKLWQLSCCAYARRSMLQWS